MRARQYYRSFSRSRSGSRSPQFENRKINNYRKRKQSNSPKRNDQNTQKKIYPSDHPKDSENKSKESFSKALLTFCDALIIDSLNV